MAPERFYGGNIGGSSKESDVYSLAMTSFEARFSSANRPAIWCDHPVTIRSSLGYCHTVAVIKPRWPPILGTVNDHPVRQTQVRTNGCETLFGIRLRPVGAINPNSGISFLLCTVFFQGTVCRMP
jgi:hypothetical protein